MIRIIELISLLGLLKYSFSGYDLPILFSLIQKLNKA